jgi:hypothetical protein
VIRRRRAAAPAASHLEDRWKKPEAAVALRRVACAAVLLFLGLGLAAPPTQAETRPTVVELFTSQGCSSCPPADALLGELAARGDVIALGFHISYWDSLGWKDPFSSPQSTERQRAYARLFEGQVYTPQLVVDGAREMVGSRRDEVMAALREASHEPIAPVAFAADRHSVTIGPAATAGSNGQVVLVRFVQQRTTPIGAGENARRTAEDTNGVKALAMLGAWQGAGVEFAVEPPAAGEGIAVLVQAANGKMLGAAVLLGS